LSGSVISSAATSGPTPRTGVCCADIEHVKTGEGWLYLAALQDLYSRRIVVWAMEPHMRQELVVAAGEMAVRRRRRPRARFTTPTTAADTSA
jgi:transposase InsO family protein